MDAAKKVSVGLGVALVGVAWGQFLGGARPLGMGAYTAIAENAYGVMWNPAAIGANRKTMFSADLQAGIFGPFSSFEDLIKDVPDTKAEWSDLAQRINSGITDVNVSGDLHYVTGKWGFAFEQYGSALFVPRDPEGNIGIKYVPINGHNVPEPGSTNTFGGAIGSLGVVTYATAVSPTIKLGVNAKLFSQAAIAGRLEWTGEQDPVKLTTEGEQKVSLAGDVGSMFDLKNGWTAAAVVQNIGSAVEMIWPLTGTLGTAYRAPGHRLLAAADLVVPQGEPTKLNFGGEYDLGRGFAIRTGLYRSEWTMGASLGPLEIAYTPSRTYAGIGLHF